MALDGIHNIGQQAVSRTATNETSATLGAHKVKIGGNPPLRLDRVGTSYIPPLGFKSKTRFANATQGMKMQADIMLGALQRKNGSLDVKAFLKASNTFTAYAGYQARNSSETVSPMATVKEMAHGVSQLSNDDLCNVYSTLLSHDMSDLKDALNMEARTYSGNSSEMMGTLSNIMDLEALVVSEVSRRMAVATLPPEETEHLQTLDNMYGYGSEEAQVTQRGENDMKATAMGGVIDHMADNDIRDTGKNEDYDKLMDAHGLSPLNIRQIGDSMRSAELTLNINGNLLFGLDEEDEMPVGDPGFRVKNLFELKEEGINTQSRAYEEFRTGSENSMFPSLKGKMDGRSRPVYGALNMMNKPLGACGAGYGRCALVLKEEVKQISTYTFGDTLMIPELKVTPDKEQAFIGVLETYANELTPKTLEDLRNPDSELRQAIHERFSEPQNASLLQIANSPVGWRIFSNISLVSGDRPTYIYQNALFQSCIDSEKNYSHVATFDHLENLLPSMSQASQLMIDVMNREHIPGVAFKDAEYIEAQIPRAVTLDDVAEIRISEDEYSPEHLEKIQQWAEERGIQVTVISAEMEVNMGDVTEKNQDKLIDRVTTLHEDVAQEDFQNLVQNFPVQEKADEMVARHPQGAAIRNLIGDGPVIRGTFAQRVGGALMATAQNCKKESDMGFIYEDGFNAEMTKTLEEQLAVKLNLLAKVDTLEFENIAQKQAFSKWVLESQALKTEHEMVALYRGMKESSEMISAFLTGPDADNPAAFCELMTRVHKHNDTIVGQVIGGYDRGGFGADDMNASFNRLQFLAVAYLRNAANGSEIMPRMAKLIASREFGTLKSFFNSVAETINDGGVSGGGDVGQLTVARNFHTYLTCLEQSMQALFQFSPMPSQRVDVSTIPDSMRNKLLEPFPDLLEVVNRLRPATNAMREVSSAGHPLPNILTSSFEARRDFLINALEVYHQHDLTFDRRSDYHGRSHACRVFVFANVMANILRERGVDVDVDTVAYSAAGHDLGRKGSGADVWEDYSAFETIGQICDLTNVDPGEDFLRGIYDSITSDQDNAPTLEALLLHSADSLDYSRVGPLDMKFFPFLREPIVHNGVIIHDDQELRNQLATEAYKLAELTHPGVMTRNIMNDYQTRAMDINATEADQNAYQQARDILLNVFEDRAINDTNLQVLERIERTIHENPTVFPLLNVYYN